MRAAALAGMVAAAFCLLALPAAQACDVDIAPGGETADAACPILADGLNTFPNRCWSIYPPDSRRRFRLSILPEAEEERALSIKLKKKDPPNNDGKHKHEVRVATPLRCGFDGTVWYSFAFAIEGDFSSQDTRWVIGQWKDDTDDSPFLAQRFNRGVFYITVEERRRDLPPGSDDPQRTVRRVIAFGPGYTSTSAPFLTDRFISDFRIRNPLASIEPVFRPNTEPAIDDYDLGALEKTLNDPLPETFPFLDDAQAYGNERQIRIHPSLNPLLPDPTKGLVHMKYRVSMQRDGMSEIDVWANGRYIVSVTGVLGGPDAGGPTRYFKFGHYRDIEDDGFAWSKIYLDDFKRGPTEADVN